MPRRLLPPVLLVLLTLLAATGCGDDGSDDEAIETDEETTTTVAEDGDSELEGVDRVRSIDACEVFTAADAETVLGGPVTPQPPPPAEDPFFCGYADQDGTVAQFSLLPGGENAYAGFESNQGADPARQEVDGLGDEAFFGSGVLVVLDDDVVAALGVNEAGGAPAQPDLEPLQTVMATLLERT